MVLEVVLVVLEVVLQLLLLQLLLLQLFYYSFVSFQSSKPFKTARDHLPIYKLDLPDPISRVPDLKKANLRAKNPKN